MKPLCECMCLHCVCVSMVSRVSCEQKCCLVDHVSRCSFPYVWSRIGARFRLFHQMLSLLEDRAHQNSFVIPRQPPRRKHRTTTRHHHTKIVIAPQRGVLRVCVLVPEHENGDHQEKIFRFFSRQRSHAFCLSFSRTPTLAVGSISHVFLPRGLKLWRRRCGFLFLVCARSHDPLIRRVSFGGTRFAAHVCTVFFLLFLVRASSL
jgi:hypothetical protein